MRPPRRTFAAPFVITAAAIPAVLACNPPPPRAPQPRPEPKHVNPPRPEPPQTSGTGAPECDQLRDALCEDNAQCKADFEREAHADTSMSDQEKGKLCKSLLDDKTALAEFKKGMQEKLNGNASKPDVIANPPRPTPVPATPPQLRSWTVSMKGGKCTAFDNNACHFDAKPGQPVPPCNPPPPRAIKCPDGVAEGASVKVSEYAQNECRIDPGPPPPCPPKAMCNPPPPRKVDCP